MGKHVRRIHLPHHMIGLIGLYCAFTEWSWWFVPTFLIFNFWLSGLGQSIGFHRYFTHRAFKTNRFWHYAMLYGGSFAGQGSVVFWVALHRHHHQNSDTEKDLHSPVHGFWSAYMGWIFKLRSDDVPLRKAGDIIKDPHIRWLHKNYEGVVNLFHFAVLALLWFEPTRIFGAAIGVAMLIGIHQEAVVNTLCHLPSIGQAPYHWRTEDNSRNIWWLNWPTWGQAFHHTHHMYPNAANFMLDKPGKADLGYRVIRRIETVAT